MTNVEIIKDYIRLHQSPKRFSHTCGVAGDCVQLSEIFDFSPEKREKLGFPTVCIGRNVKIPRLAFLKFMGYDGPIAK